jgi:hypothetical protein
MGYVKFFEVDMATQVEVEAKVAKTTMSGVNSSLKIKKMRWE